MGNMTLAPALKAVVATGIHAKFRFVARYGEGESERCEFPNVEVRIFTAARWKKLKSRYHGHKSPWSTVLLDDGVVMATKIVLDGDSTTQTPVVGGTDDTDPERAAAVRLLRGRLIDFLDAEESLDYVSVDLDGCSGATFRCQTADLPFDRTENAGRESVVVAIGNDPDN